jgi:GrpB-like predicted nucleotidyltransferase (UPF0157 family)
MTDDLNKFTTQKLELLLPITLVDYNPNWYKLYLREKLNILKSIGCHNIIRIEHIGSTSVPELQKYALHCRTVTRNELIS